MKTREQVIRKSLNNTFDRCRVSLGRVSLAGTLAVATLFAFGQALFAQQQDQPRKPMQATLEDGAEHRWLNKTVIDSRLLDSMENLADLVLQRRRRHDALRRHKKDGEHSLKIESTLQHSPRRRQRRMGRPDRDAQVPRRGLAEIQPHFPLGVCGCRRCPGARRIAHASQ